MIARSTGSGRSRILGYARIEPTTEGVWVHWVDGPLKAIHDQGFEDPKADARGVARGPTTATDVGRNNGRSEAVVNSRSSSPRATLASVGSTAKASCTSPCSSVSCT